MLDRGEDFLHIVLCPSNDPIEQGAAWARCFRDGSSVVVEYDGAGRRGDGRFVTL